MEICFFYVSFRSYLWEFVILLSYVGHEISRDNNVMNFHNFVLFLHIFISECNFYCLKLLPISWYICLWRLNGLGVRAGEHTRQAPGES